MVAVGIALLMTDCISQASSGTSDVGGQHASCVPTPGDRSQGALGVGADASWRVTLGPGQEVAATEATIAAGARGDKLKVSGTVFDSKCRPLSGAAVNAWQATADGAYGPGQDKGELHCCYLTGGVRTNQAGRYEFDTVMPGRYQSHPAYIHIAVTHSRAGQLLTEVHFAADPLEGSGEQFTVVRLTKAADGGLLATFDIVLAGY